MTVPRKELTKCFYRYMYSKKTTVNSCFYYNSEKG